MNERERERERGGGGEGGREGERQETGGEKKRNSVRENRRNVPVDNLSKSGEGKAWRCNGRQNYCSKRHNTKNSRNHRERWFKVARRETKYTSGDFAVKAVCMFARVTYRMKKKAGDHHPRNSAQPSFEVV